MHPHSPEPQSRTEAAPRRQPHGDPARGDPGLLALQRSAGNAAVSSLVAQRGVMAQIGNAFRSDESLIPKADDGDLDAINAISDYGKLDDARRIKYIGLLVAEGDKMGWRNKRALLHLWSAYGDGVLAPAHANGDLWAKSIAANNDIGAIGPLASARDQFSVEVRNLARAILDSNDAEIIRQFERLGADEKGEIKPSSLGTDAKSSLDAKDQARLAAQQKGAARIVNAQDYQRSLEATVIGYMDTGEQAHDPPYKTEPVTLGQVIGGTGVPPQGLIAPPANAPVFEQLKSAHDLAAAVVTGEMVRWPALFSLVGGSTKSSAGSPELQKVAAGTPDEGRTQLLTTLKDTRKHIADAKGDIIDPDFVLDLTTLHKKIMAPGGGALPWGNPVYKPVVDGFVREHNEQKAMAVLGLSTVAGLAFILAEFATAGMATFLAVGIGVTASAAAAGDSIDNAIKKNDVEGAAISPDTRMIEEGKANEATLDAVMQSVFTVVDFALAAKTLIGASKAVEGLRELDNVAKTEAATRIERSVEEIGAAATVRASGKTVEELMAFLPAESRAAQALGITKGEIAVATGIGSATALKNATLAAEALGKEWMQLGTVEARASRIEEVINKALADVGAPTPCKVIVRPEPGQGALIFHSNQYEVSIPSGWLGANAVESAPKLMALAHHEARHAEQMFLVARRMRFQNVSRADIIARTKLPERIVDAAVVPLADSAPEAAAVDRWLASTTTEAGQKLREVAYRDLDAASKELTQAKQAVRDAERGGNQQALKNAKNELEDKQVLFDASYDQYRKLPEELDAWGINEQIEANLITRGNIRMGVGVGVGVGVGAAVGLGYAEMR